MPQNFTIAIAQQLGIYNDTQCVVSVIICDLFNEQINGLKLSTESYLPWKF